MKGIMKNGDEMKGMMKDDDGIKWVMMDDETEDRSEKDGKKQNKND